MIKVLLANKLVLSAINFSKEKSISPRLSTDGTAILAQLLQHFNIGYSPGIGLNCLIYTIYQLANSQQVIDINHNAITQTVQNIRQTLIQGGYAIQNEMIDVYSGAGAQMAEAFNIRIRVIEITNNGNVLIHPVLGNGAGPIHFTPLWPINR